MNEDRIRLDQDFLRRKDHGYHVRDHKKVGLGHLDDARNQDAFPLLLLRFISAHA